MIKVLVIGGGPAGSATALSLIRNARANGATCFEVIQVCGPDASRDAIGETIPPAATEFLRQLGVASVLNHKSHIICPGSRSIWGGDTPGYNDFFFTPVGNGYHLDRPMFNQQLRAAAQKQGIVVMAGAKLAGLTSTPSGFELTIEQNGECQNLEADFVVDATGIQAKIARSLGVARNQYDSVISACHILELPDSADEPPHTLVCAVPDGWWYGTQLPNKKALISLSTDKETLKQKGLNQPVNWLNAWKESGWFHQQCSSQFGTEICLPKLIDCRVAPSAILSCVVGDKWMAVGDAASSYDSMTSAGISKALEQGILAGKVIVKHFVSQEKKPLIAYQQKVFDAFNQYLALHQTLYCAEQRFKFSGFWQRRQFSLP